MKCAICDADALYRCAATGAPVCPAHARLTVTRRGEHPFTPAPRHPITIRPATPADRPAVESLTLYFWDETDVDCFGQRYDVRALPVFVADDEGQVVGCLAYAVEGDTMTVVTLNVLPSHQGQGVGRRLLQATVDEARARDLAAVRVATTNDDLPALAFYQRHGFRLTNLLPGLVADHHGEELAGLDGIPIRDEMQLLLTIR